MNYRHSIGAGLLLAILAQSAAGQKSKMGTTSPDWDKVGKSSSPAGPQMLSKKDMEEMSPIKRLMEKKKDLKLTDAQVTKLKEMETAGNGRDASLYEAMDSLRKEMRPSGGGGGGGDDQRVKMFSAREAFTKAVTDLRAHYASDGTASLEVLDESQRPAAKDLLEKQAKDSDKVVEEKMRAGRPGGRPNGGAGGGPGKKGGPPLG